jgi:pimeloyl-ACP methyl ester carboxylesterase
MYLQVDDKKVYAYTGTKPVDPGQPSVVFVHGAGTDHTVWELQSRYLAHHGRNVLAPDLPGHGASQGPPLTDIPELADWIARLLDAAGLTRGALVGHSMGALAALEAAAGHPQRVTALALVGVSVPMPVNEELLAAARADQHAAFEMITLWAHSDGARMGGNPNPGMWMTGGGLRLLERAKPGVLHADLSACDGYRHGLQSAARVACPVLLVLGERDLMAPPGAARELAATLPDARTVLLPQCGHQLMMERPEQVLDALLGLV